MQKMWSPQLLKTCINRTRDYFKKFIMIAKEFKPREPLLGLYSIPNNYP
jgi:hypothetical protein